MTVPGPPQVPSARPAGDGGGLIRISVFFRIAL
jgi:hypothetical protein